VAEPGRVEVPAHSQAGGRVSTLELFFDLVFVFTITQIALIVEHHPSWDSVAQALLVLLVIYWMYGGYAWLTNTVGTAASGQKVVLLLGMAAFLVTSLAVPHAFGHDAVAFGYAYLLLTAVHIAGFLIGGGQAVSAAMRSIGAANLLACACLIAAGYAGAPAHWPLWIAAVLVQWGPALISRSTGAFAIDVDHFAERHGLMIIIVLGESLISVALAANSQPVTVDLVAGVLCGLAASAALWWCYFGGDEERAMHRLAAADSAQRGRLALVGYDIPHVFMMAGIVAVAAGSRLSLPALTSPTSLAAASLLAGGAAVYLVALAAFRHLLHYASGMLRCLAAAIVLGLIPVGTHAGAAQQLAATAGVIALLLLTERLVRAPVRGRTRSIGQDVSHD
jgi:low temperature requirement protein LtrA